MQDTATDAEADGRDVQAFTLHRTKEMADRYVKGMRTATVEPGRSETKQKFYYPAVLLLSALLTCSFQAYAAPPESVYLRPFDRTMQAIYSSEAWLDHCGAVAVFGDSHNHRRNLAALHPRADQHAISGSNSLGLCRQLKAYPRPAKEADAVVIQIGTNDVAAVLAGLWTLEDVAEASACIAAKVTVPLVWTAPPYVGPVGTMPNGSKRSLMSAETAATRNALVDQVRDIQRAACSVKPDCVYVESPLTDPEYQTFDGMHESQAGYDLVNAAERAALEGLGVRP